MNAPVSILAKGTQFARMAIALSRVKGEGHSAIPVAESLWGAGSIPARAIKQAVDAGSTTDWSALADYRHVSTDFIEAVRPLTILGKLAGMRRLPLLTRVPRATAGAAVGWVGEKSPAPITGLSLDTVQLGVMKLAGIVVTTRELSQLASPAAEGLIRSDLLAATAEASDRAFIDPSNAGEAGVKPASVSYGAPSVPASGTSAAALRADLRALFKLVVDEGINLIAPALVTDRVMAVSLALMDSPLTEQVTVNGGMLAGVPLITSSSSPTGGVGNSPAAVTSTITLIDAAEILIGDVDQAEISYSQQTALQMDSAPDSPSTGSTTLVSLYQHGLSAWRVARQINWQLRRPGAVAYISGASYGE